MVIFASRLFKTDIGLAMDYELITSRINVRLVLTKVWPVYHFYLLYKKFISHYLLFLSLSL